MQISRPNSAQLSAKPQHRESKEITHQGRGRVQGIRQHQANQTCIDAGSDERGHRQQRDDKDNQSANKFQSDSEPAVDRYTGEVTDLVAINTALVGRDEDRLLAECTDCRETGQRLGKPREDRGPRDGVETFDFPRGSEIVPVRMS